MRYDLFGKPVSTPDHVRARLFPDHALKAAKKKMGRRFP
jgi:hypothetical protein